MSEQKAKDLIDIVELLVDNPKFEQAIRESGDLELLQQYAMLLNNWACMLVPLESSQNLQTLPLNPEVSKGSNGKIEPVLADPQSLDKPDHDQLSELIESFDGNRKVAIPYKRWTKHLVDNPNVSFEQLRKSCEETGCYLEAEPLHIGPGQDESLKK